MAFRDIDPKAPTHILVIPTEHVASLDEAKDPAQVGRLMLAAAEIARSEGITDGYRTVVNTRRRRADRRCSTCHLHLLGGRKLDLAAGLTSARNRSNDAMTDHQRTLPHSCARR